MHAAIGATWRKRNKIVGNSYNSQRLLLFRACIGIFLRPYTVSILNTVSITMVSNENLRIRFTVDYHPPPPQDLNKKWSNKTNSSCSEKPVR